MDVHRGSCGLLWRLVGHSSGKSYRRLQDSQDQGSPLVGKNILTGSCLGWPKCQSRNLWDLSSNSRSSDLWLCGTFIDDAFMMHRFIAYCWVTLIIWFVAFPYPENIAVAIGDHDPWFKVKNTWNHQPNILALKPMVLTEAVIKDTSQQHYPCHRESHGRASLVKNQNCCGCWGPLNPLISPNPEHAPIQSLSTTSAHYFVNMHTSQLCLQEWREQPGFHHSNAAFCDCDTSAPQPMKSWRACGHLLLWFFTTWRRAEPGYGRLSPKRSPPYFHVKQNFYITTSKSIPESALNYSGLPSVAAEAVGTVPTKPAGRAAVLDTLLPGAGHMKGACEVPERRWIYDLFLFFSIFFHTELVFPRDDWNSHRISQFDGSRILDVTIITPIIPWAIPQ